MCQPPVGTPEMISYPHVFELDGQTYLAYLGNQVGRHGFGLAVLEGTLDYPGAMKWTNSARSLTRQHTPCPRLRAVCPVAAGPGVRGLRADLFLHPISGQRQVPQPDRLCRHAQEPARCHSGFGRQRHALGWIGLLRRARHFPGHERCAPWATWSMRIRAAGADACRSRSTPALAWPSATIRGTFRAIRRWPGSERVFARALSGGRRVCEDHWFGVPHVVHLWHWLEDSTRQTPAPDRTYKIGHATSTDGIHWVKEEARQIIADRLGPDESQALPCVIEIDGRFHMFFCYRQSFDFRVNAGRGYRIGHAWSDDLNHWQRDDAQALLDVTPGAWDGDMVCYPHVFECDGQGLHAVQRQRVRSLRFWPGGIGAMRHSFMNATVGPAQGRAVGPPASYVTTTFRALAQRRVHVDRYAEKISQNAVRFEAWAAGELVGLVATYCNDHAKAGPSSPVSACCLAGKAGASPRS